MIFAAFAGLFAIAWFAPQMASLEELARHEWELRQWISENGWRAIVVGLFAYTLVSMVPGAVGKTVATGWLFGFWYATLISTVGLTLSALASFGLSRYVFREWVEHRLRRFVWRINVALKKEGVFYLLTLRLMHAPFSIVNYASGVCRVRASTFLWTTAVGLLPSNAVHAWLGSQLPTLDEVARDGVETLLKPWLIACWIALALLPWLGKWVARRLQPRTK